MSEITQITPSNLNLFSLWDFEETPYGEMGWLKEEYYPFGEEIDGVIYLRIQNEMTFFEVELGLRFRTNSTLTMDRERFDVDCSKEQILSTMTTSLDIFLQKTKNRIQKTEEALALARKI